jgi:polyferredoxin
VTPVRIRTAVLIAVLATAVAWVGLDTWTGAGGEPLPLGWASVAGTLALVAVVVAAGLPVRRWTLGRRERPLDPLVAARTAVLAKAAVYVGAVLVGWYLGQALDTYPDLVGARRTRFVIGLVAAVSAVLLSAAGFVVQRWCRVPPSDDESDTGGTAEHDAVP